MRDAQRANISAVSLVSQMSVGSLQCIQVLQLDDEEHFLDTAPTGDCKERVALSLLEARADDLRGVTDK